MRFPQFVSERIEPCSADFDAAAMASGCPGVPLRFRWRGKEICVRSVLSSEKTIRPCRNGSSDRYIDKHIYRVETEDGRVMTLYRRRTGKRRDVWTLFTIGPVQ